MSRIHREVPWLDWVSGVAYAHWYDRQARRTKRISLGTKDPSEAAHRFGQFLTEGQAIREPSRLDGVNLRHVFDDYLREHVASKVIDKDRQNSAINNVLEFFGDDKLLRDIDIPASRAYADARRAGGLGGGKRRDPCPATDSTIRRELHVLSAAARHALKWRRIKSDEMPSLELPSETRAEALTENDWLTRDEVKRATDAAGGRLRDFMVILYDTASRRAAIENLTKFQVDLKAGRVNLRSPAESDLQRRSKKRRPVVPISPDARPVYERLMKTGDTQWLFGSNADMYRPFVEHMRAVELGHKSNPHIFRHSRATHLLQGGVSLWDVAKLLGDTVATVERVYGHACPNYLGQTIARVT